MTQFFMDNWSTLLLGLISAGLLGFCRYIWKQMKTYKALIDDKEKDATEDMIDKKLEPILQDLEDLRGYIRDTKNIEKSHMNLIIASYRYRLIQLCKLYLKQGFMTHDNYEQLSEFYKLYTGLGGNGQAKEYYEKTIALPIKSEDDD